MAGKGFGKKKPVKAAGKAPAKCKKGHPPKR